MSDNFYKAFEDKYRGSRELIKTRLQIYIPFLKALLGIYPNSGAIDLGCGRGEWLEILKELGFKGKGVDLDSEMLSACTVLDLDVKNIDALSALASLKDESQSVVSAFHLVEHLSFDDVKLLVAEGLRVLKPGGLLILETPNPENIVVGSNSFYLDPSHQRPIPPLLLSFAAEFYGFDRVKVIRVQEPAHLVGDGPVLLNDVLTGVSPDYAVVAQKKADNALLELFSPIFNAHYGLPLQDLAERFDAKLVGTMTKADEIKNIVGDVQLHADWLEKEWQESKAKTSKLTDDLIQTKELLSTSTSELNQAKASLLEAYKNIDWLEGKNKELDNFVQNILRSASWKITGPLREATNFLKSIFRRLKKMISQILSIPKKLIRSCIYKVSTWSRLHPNLRYRLVVFLSRFPRFEHILKTNVLRSEINMNLQKLGENQGSSGAQIMNIDDDSISVIKPNVDEILARIKQKLDEGDKK
jgi:O-antigen chain-terminating methyltransferase